jgi:hypothetical protein
MSTQPPNLVNSSTPSGQSPLLNGINAAGGWGKALSGLVQLPGAMWNSFQAGNQAANAKNAATGQPYQIPGGIGIAQNAKALTATNANKPTATSGIIPVANTQTNPPASGAGVSDIPNNNGTLQDELASKQSQLASLQAQEAALDKSNAATNTYNGGVSGTGQTFPGYVSTLANTSASPTQGFTTAQNQALSAANALQNTAPQQNAAVLAQQQQIQQLQNDEATATGQTQNQPGISLQQASGEQGLLNTLYTGKLNAAETGLTNILSGNTQQQTALNEAGGLANTASGNATGQQQAQIGGQSAAAGLAAPQAGQNPATQSYNPLTDQYSGLAALSAGGNSDQTAQQALASLGQTLGGETAGANLVPLQQALAAGQGASDNITSYLQQNPDLNSSTLNIGNLAAQWASGQYSGANAAKYQTLGDYLTTFATQMAPLLAPGGTATDAARALQQSLVKGSANNQTIQQVLAQLTSEAKGTLANRASGAGGGGAVSSGSSVTSVPGGTNPVSEGTTQSVGGGNYVYQNGKWIAK